MIIFWILAGGLLGLALLFILMPLLRPKQLTESPEQDALNLDVFRERLRELDADLGAGFLERDQYDAARHDLERDLLHDLDDKGSKPPVTKPASMIARWLLAGLLATCIPVATVLMYLEMGDPNIIGHLEATASTPSATAAEHAGTEREMPSMEVLVQRLEDRLKENPGNVDGWLILGRTYFATDQLDQGLDAIKKAYELAPEQPEVMLAYAEALAATSDSKSLEGRPAELIQAALSKDPDNASARWLAGMLDYQRGQFEDAVNVWQGILDEMDAGSEESKNLGQMIAEARDRANLPPMAAQAPSPSATTAAPDETRAQASPAPDVTSTTETSPATEGASVTAKVTLTPELAAQASPEDSVFVFARAAAGPPMPLAVQRIQVKDLPQTVTLDDSMAMMPAMRLSAFPEVVIGARVSKSGQAMPQPGDLEGEIGPLKLDENNSVSVSIDRVRR